MYLPKECISLCPACVREWIIFSHSLWSGPVEELCPPSWVIMVGSRALPPLLGDNGQIYCMTITEYHIPKAVHPFIVPVPIEGLLLPPIKDPSVVDCIHQHAVLFPEKQDVEVGMETKYKSISMQDWEFPEILKEPMGGISTKGDKGLGKKYFHQVVSRKDIFTMSDLNLKHLICLMEHPPHRAPCIPV
jgi:hypothetical protein